MIDVGNILVKDYIKKLDFRVLSESKKERCNNWVERLKKRNDQFLKKRLHSITLAEWMEFGKVFDYLGEAESKTLILFFFPEYIDEIRAMKYWDVAYCLLSDDVEKGKKIQMWYDFLERVNKTTEQYRC